MGFFAVLAASLFAVFLFTVFGGYSLLLWCQQSLWMVVPPALVLAVLVWTFLKMDDKITALQKRVDELEAAEKTEIIQRRPSQKKFSAKDGAAFCERFHVGLPVVTDLIEHSPGRFAPRSPSADCRCICVPPSRQRPARWRAEENCCSTRTRCKGCTGKASHTYSGEEVTNTIRTSGSACRSRRAVSMPLVPAMQIPRNTTAYKPGSAAARRKSSPQVNHVHSASGSCCCSSSSSRWASRV